MNNFRLLVVQQLTHLKIAFRKKALCIGVRQLRVSLLRASMISVIPLIDSQVGSRDHALQPDQPRHFHAPWLLESMREKMAWDKAAKLLVQTIAAGTSPMNRHKIECKSEQNHEQRAN